MPCWKRWVLDKVVTGKGRTGSGLAYCCVQLWYKIFSSEYMSQWYLLWFTGIYHGVGSWSSETQGTERRIAEEAGICHVLPFLYIFYHLIGRNFDYICMSVHLLTSPVISRILVGQQMLSPLLKYLQLLVLRLWKLVTEKLRGLFTLNC